jgi:hypothetical protein
MAQFFGSLIVCVETKKRYSNKQLTQVENTNSTYTIKEPKCLIRGKTNKQYYCHQVVQGAIVSPELRQVIPVMPEEICAQDGDKKEDCKVNAFMRFMDKFRKDHDKLGVIVNGDALYAKTQVIAKIHEHKANYIFKIEEANHATLFKNLAAIEKSVL